MISLYAFIPVAVAFLGAIWITFRRPSPAAIGAIQHFAAGVVFYAAAGELLPDATRQAAVWPIVAGGAAGVAAMLVLRSFDEPRRQQELGLIAAAAVDALIDGLVLGLGFNVGRRQGILLAIALSIEFLFLGLSIAAAFDRSAARWKVIGAATGVSLAVPVGALAAWPIGGLPEQWQAVAFSFGLIALLYLVTEELLTEAHEKPEPPWATAMFFVGFLSLTMIAKLMSAGS